MLAKYSVVVAHKTQIKSFQIPSAHICRILSNPFVGAKKKKVKGATNFVQLLNTFINKFSPRDPAVTLKIPSVA